METDGGPGVRLEDDWTEVSWEGRALVLHHVRAAPAAGRPPAQPPEPLVLVHGMVSSWRQWRTLMLRLGARLELWALDLPGFGQSGQPRRRLEGEDYAAILERWAAARGLARLRAVGHSFGGAVVLDWAGRWPERFARLGCLAPAAVYHEWFTAGGGPIRWPVVGPLLLRPFAWLVSTRWLGPRFFGHIVARLEDVRPDEVRDLQWGCRRAREALRALDYYRFPHLDERLAAIAAPTLFGWGTADRVVPAADAAYYLARVRDAALWTWEGCGHMPMLERRAECDAFVWEVAVGQGPLRRGG
jgi:pimeloyl-ACP methyl ester carboxylesterase